MNSITEVELNVLAQRFYEASGLSLSGLDKPNIVAGLRAVFLIHESEIDIRNTRLQRVVDRAYTVATMESGEAAARVLGAHTIAPKDPTENGMCVECGGATDGSGEHVDGSASRQGEIEKYQRALLGAATALNDLRDENTRLRGVIEAMKKASEPEWFCYSCGYPYPAGEGNPNTGKWEKCSICNNDEWSRRDATPGTLTTSPQPTTETKGTA